MGPREGSLASKLLQLKPGEAFYLDDVFAGGSATQMERQVTNLLAKVPALKERNFRTERWAAVRTAPAEARDILRVVRDT